MELEVLIAPAHPFAVVRFAAFERAQTDETNPCGARSCLAQGDLRRDARLYHGSTKHQPHNSPTTWRPQRAALAMPTRRQTAGKEVPALTIRGKSPTEQLDKVWVNPNDLGQVEK